MNDRPRKRFGQHFLHDPHVIARIVETLNPHPGERLVEIGPGRGALTVPVLARTGRLDVIEVDRDLAAKLRTTPPADGKLVIHEHDALQFDFGALAQADENLRVFGNLPYNISTPLLFHLMRYADVVADMLFMLQREVVERMVASPGNKTYGRLTVMLASVAHAEKCFTVGRGAFTPPPKVESAIVRIVPRRASKLALPDPGQFAALVALAFSHRRKTLRNAVAGLATTGQIEAAGLDPGARPETIAPEGFAALSCRIYEDLASGKLLE